MAYKDKHGITDIRPDEQNNVSISRDEDMNFDTGEEFPVMCILYTPTMTDTDVHYHIPLNVKECIALRDWLNEFIKEHTND